jgi:hypothetical protein
MADYEQLRRLVSPEQSLTVLDDFAKWLFVIAATVGALGTSFGVSGANDLTGSGRKMFAWAVASVGVSLALAALARLPVPKRCSLPPLLSLLVYRHCSRDRSTQQAVRLWLD